MVLLLALSAPAVYAQSDNKMPSMVSANENSTFPVIAHTPNKAYEVDLTWEPHKILTDQKIIFIFQFYDRATGSTVPHIDYHFVITQNGNELANIPGTTTRAGDYKYFAFDNPGPVTISLEKIGDTAQQVSYDTMVSKNPHPTGPVTVTQPPRNISNQQRAIFPILEDVIIGGLIALLVWVAREHIFRRFRAVQ